MNKVDIMNWQAFAKDDGSIDADKGSVLTIYAKPGVDAPPLVRDLTRRETATMLGAMSLTSEFLHGKRQAEATKAFADETKSARV